jgi:hypothetical protein
VLDILGEWDFMMNEYFKTPKSCVSYMRYEEIDETLSIRQTNNAIII